MKKLFTILLSIGVGVIIGSAVVSVRADEPTAQSNESCVAVTPELQEKLCGPKEEPQPVTEEQTVVPPTDETPAPSTEPVTTPGSNTCQ